MAGLVFAPRPPPPPRPTWAGPPPISITSTFAPRYITPHGQRPEAFQSITIQTEHRAYSFEELRLNDYQHGHGVITHPTTSDFTSHGLMLANVPFLQVFEQSKSVRSKAASSAPLGSTIVTFRVGNTSPEDFVIHEGLLRNRSDFVRLALSKDWKEAKERIITLPDDEPATFSLYQQFIYTHHIPSAGKELVDGIDDEYRLLVHAYLLGERFMDPDFKDAVMDAMLFKFRTSRVFDARLTRLVWENTRPLSRLRHFWLEVYVFAGSPGWLEEDGLEELINADFALDLSKFEMSLRQSRQGNGPLYLDNTCGYHEHANGGCYRRLFER